LARPTPGYFFGSKEGLYDAVLRRVHEQRSEAVGAACAPIHEWAADPSLGVDALAEAIAAAVDGYFGFLERRPEFARLIEWESLSDAKRLPPDLSGAFSDAFRAVHRVRRMRGLRDFDVETVVVALVSLCFLPAAHANTFAAGARIDTSGLRFRVRYRAQVVESVLAMLLPASDVDDRA
jgi:AcrR family transcriptional regulator